MRKYRNLEAELARAGIKKRDLAGAVGCTPPTLTLKLTGRAPVSLPEALKIKNYIGTSVPLEVLFAETT